MMGIFEEKAMSFQFKMHEQFKYTKSENHILWNGRSKVHEPKNKSKITNRNKEFSFFESLKEYLQSTECTHYNCRICINLYL